MIRLYYNYDARFLCDADARQIYELPELSFDEQPTWVVTPLYDDATPLDLGGITTFRAAIDEDFKSETSVMCRTLPESITVDENGIHVPLDSNTQRFLEVVNGKDQVMVIFELAGFDAAGKRAFYLKFRFNASALVDPADTDTLPETVDLFADRAYVMALFRSGFEIQFSQNGTEWSGDADDPHYYRIRNRQAGGEWSEAIPMLRGADGRSLRPDAAGLLADRPGTAEEKYCYLATDTRKIYLYLNGAWSDGIDAGVDGRGIASIAKTGTAGLIDTYQITYTDGSKSEYNVKNGGSLYDLALETGYTGTKDEFLVSMKGENGAPGQDLRIDATGDIEELATYADKPAGFVFASTVRDSAARTTTMYLYVKKSYALNDWCKPLAITYYSKGETLPLIKPLEFQAPEGDAKILSFQFKDYPAASVASVVIDTTLGELTLPYWSALGIEKIYRRQTGQVDIYFGSLCPEFETGRVYFSQGAAGLTQYQWYVENGGTLTFDEWMAAASSAVPEAPKDGRIYGRCNGAWIVLENAGALTITGTTSYTVNGALDTVLTQTLDAVASDGSAVSFAVTEGTLPAGLTLNGNTISGTPTATASTTVKITATAGTASLVISVTFLIADAPEPMYYGYITSEVAGSVIKVTQITTAMITAAIEAGTMQEAIPVELNKTSIGTVPAGALIAVMIPTAAGMSAAKFDGIGGQAAFDLDNGGAGTGANGASVTLDDTSYKVYGEFALVAGERYIYVVKS